MDILVEIFGAMVVAGFGRARRRPRPVEHVRASRWHALAIGATVANIGVLLAGTWLLARFVLLLLREDLLFFLALLFLPVALVGIGAALGASGWLVNTVRRLLVHDASVRVDLAVQGSAGLVLALWLAWTLDAALVVPVALPSVACVAVALVPAAWLPPNPDWHPSPV